MGLFLDRETVQALERAPEGAQQLGFPKHARRPEPAPSGYLKCPVCSQLMNRTVFMRSSKVIVDVCRTDGVWFDAGEVQAVVEFLERGGAEAAREQARSERETEREKLRSQRIREIEARAGTAASRRELERSPIMSLFKLF